MTAYDLTKTTIYSSPKVFTDKHGNAVLIRLLEEDRHEELLEGYLAYRPRNSFDGLPPITDEACARWATSMITNSISLVATSLEGSLIGHAALFPMDDERCEMFIVVTPEHQRCGIGNQLIHCIVQLAYEIGFEKIWLSVDANNFIAKHLYNKCGFNYITRGFVDQVEMQLDLRQYHQSASVRIDSVMNRDVISIHQDLSCREAIEIFLKNNIGSLPVVNDSGEVIGILSETDLIIGANVQRTVGEVMTREVISVKPTTTLDVVIRFFQSTRTRCIPVLSTERKLVGVLGRKDILAYYVRNWNRSAESA